MRKLSKGDEARRVDIATRLVYAEVALDGAIKKYNADRTQENLDAVKDAIENKDSGINRWLEMAELLREEVHGEMEGYFEDRTEKWQESENGEAYTEWMDQWDQPDPAFEEIDFKSEVAPKTLGEPILFETPAFRDCLMELPSEV